MFDWPFLRKTLAALCCALLVPQLLAAQDRCRALRDSVEMYANAGSQYKAEHLAKNLLDICVAKYGAEDTVVANVLNTLGALKYMNNDYRGGLKLVNRADSIYQRLGLTNLQDYGSICNNYGAAYQRLGDLPLAEKYTARAVNISRLNGDTISARYGKRLGNLAVVYMEQGKFREGIPIQIEAMAITERTGDTLVLAYVLQTMNLAKAYDAIGLYDSCFLTIENAFPRAEKILAQHPFRPIIWITRGTAKYKMKQFFSAIEDFENARAICKDKNYFYAESLNGLALCYSELGWNDEALTLQLESKELIQRFMGQDYINLIAIWNNLSVIYVTKGELEKALPALQEALRIAKAKAGKTHTSYLTLLSNLGNYYLESGFYEQALSTLIVAEENCRAMYTTETAMYVRILNNLATTYAFLEMYDSSKIKLSQVLEIHSNTGDGKKSDMSFTLHSLASVYQAMGQIDSAILMARLALKNYDENGDTVNFHYAHVFNGLTQLLCESGQRELGRSANNQTIALLTNTSHVNQPKYAALLCLTADVCDLLGEHNKALRLFLRADSLLNVKAERLAGLYGYGADEAFARNFLPQYGDIAGFFFRHRRRYPQAAEILYDNTLSLSHLLLHQTRAALESARNNPDTAVATLARHWNDLRQLVVNQSDKKKPDFPLDSLERELADAESRLTVACLPLYQARKKVAWRNVQAGLAPGDAAIEFVRLLSVRDSSVRYIALLLRPGRKRPEVVDLCSETALADLLNRRIRSLTYTIGTQYQARKSRDSEVHDLIWRPLEKHLRGVRRLFFAPAGLLHQIAFAAIEDASGRSLAERMVLEQVSSTRELAFPRTLSPGSALHSAMLVGGVQYRCDSATLAEAAQRVACDFPNPEPLPPLAAAAARITGYDPDFLPPGTRGGIACSDTLPGTAREQDTLARLLASRQIPHTSLTGQDAVEQHLKCYRYPGTPPPGLLHIGTHGIYLPAAEKKVARLGDDGAFRWAENPMFRSYLVMAGGGDACAGGQVPVGTRDDGLLSAYEIAALNFSGTQLVTLSACVSALGDVRDAEGVYGLQRAFKITGARHLLLTLWPVDDTATEAFMEKFYRYWISDNLDLREAFRKTQAALRIDTRYAHPYYWAGFVLI